MEVDKTLSDEFKDLNREDLEFNKKCSKLAQDVNSGRLTIVQLVEQLGGLLVDSLPDNRELGTWILTEVLEGLSPDHLDTQQLIFICAFYSDRLKDHHKVIPAVLRGFYALAKFKNFPEGATAQFLNTLFKHVSCQQQQQKDREQIYKLFDLLLDRCKSELESMGFEFIYGVITAIDGERDPNNLLLLFKWSPKFLKSFQLKHLTEEAFEVLACYFPVDFKAPPQDPNTISRDMLANALAPCLCAIPDFADCCISLALEKLDSSLDIAKLDSLKLLEIGCKNFEVSSCVQHCTEIWSQIQKELFSNPSPPVANACYSTLKAVINKISLDPSINATLKDIVDTIKRNLMLDSKLFAPSSNLLINVAGASEQASNFVTREIAPILINTYNITNTSSNKVLVLRDLIKYFLSYTKFHSTNFEYDELKIVPILSLKSSLDESDELKTEGFESLAKIAQHLPLDVRISVYENLRKALVVFQKPEVRDSIIKCFVKLSQEYPDEVKEKLITKVEITNLVSLKLFLSALREIASQEFFVNDVIDILLEYLSKDLDTIQVTLNSGKKFLTRHENHDKILTILHEKGVVNKISDLVTSQGNNLEEKALSSASFVIKTIIGHLDSEKQSEIIQRDLAKILLQREQGRCYIILLDGFLSRLHRNVKIGYSVLEDLTNFALNGDNFVRDVSVQLLANLLNKCEQESALEGYLQNFESRQAADNENFLTILAWITKALVMRNHNSANTFIEKLIEILKVDSRVDFSFRIIMNDTYDSLSNKSYCNKTLLYRQKCFIIVSNKLCESYQPEYKSYLTAIGYLLEFTPKAAVLLQFKKILKLIILCLEECSEPEVLTVLLGIILNFVTDKQSCIEDNLTEFLSRLLKLASFEKSMNVRILALSCLQKFATSFPVYKLLPQKAEVLRVLGQCIDDKKRFVRREAVEARSVWFLLDAPI